MSLSCRHLVCLSLALDAQSGLSKSRSKTRGIYIPRSHGHPKVALVLALVILKCHPSSTSGAKCDEILINDVFSAACGLYDEARSQHWSSVCLHSDLAAPDRQERQLPVLTSNCLQSAEHGCTAECLRGDLHICCEIFLLL